MATQIIDGKRFLLRQVPKTSSRPVDEYSSKIPSNIVPPPALSPPPPPSKSSTTQSTNNTLIARTEVTPATRIVVVRTANSTQNEKEETIETNESARSKSVELPPMLTNGRTSVYLIRRPIPPPEPPRPTQLFEPLDDLGTTTTGNNLHHTGSPIPPEEIVISPSQIHPSPRRSKAFKRRPPIKHSESPNLHSDRNESPKQLLSSPEQSGDFQKTTRRSRSKSRTRDLSRPTSKHGSRHRSPSIQKKSQDVSRRRNFFSFSQKKSTGVQANLIPSETNENEQRTVENIRSSVNKRTRRRKSLISRIKSAKSIVLVNPEEQTIAVIENSYLQGETIKPFITQSNSSKNDQSTEKLVKTSRWYTCLDCLSRYICLIIIICLILILIGLAGVGVSVYFLATNSQTYFAPKIVGIAIGGVLVIAGLCFLYCILGCIGSRDGYFSYNNDGSHGGGRAFALISPIHPNAHRYIPRDYMEVYENNQTSSSNSISMISKTQQQQKSIVNGIPNATTSAKNVTIEMPERLLTGRKLSPKSHERKLHKVVNNIGHIVEDAKKRYSGDLPTKVIVKIDDNTAAQV